MKKLFESKQKVTEFLQRRHFFNTNNFFKIKILDNILKQTCFVKESYGWACKEHLSKRHEMSVGSDLITVDFLGSNRQYDW